MIAGLAARVTQRVSRWFPERQIYHRSNGHVQFVVLSPRFQILSVTGGLLCLSWIAYSSVMTAFKDEIIAAKEHRIQTLQSRYENQVATMRLDYDDLATKLAMAEERFDRTVAAVEKRQSDLQSAMADQASAGSALAEVMQRAGTVRALGLATDAPGVPLEDDANAAGGPSEEADNHGHDHEQHSSLVQEPAFPRGKPAGVAVAVAAEPIERLEKGQTSAFLASGRNLRTGESFAALENRLDAVLGNQLTAAAEIARDALEKEQDLREVLTIAGMDPNLIAPQADAQGGPFVPAVADASRIDPMTRDANLDISDETMDRVALLQTAMLAVPFANPVPGVTRISSGFGYRSDPFHGSRAYHGGLDFKGPQATDILATAPGVVTIAEWHGGYGRMVEIDHGYGLKTRYAHLSAINVEQGQKVAFGQKVGALGSTGRSTGPHLHYEIWYNGQAQNPWNYLEAGANVLKRQGT